MSDQQNSKGKVLLVDDESAVLESLNMYFEDQGYETTTAADGIEAMERLKQAPYDLVITDVYMPNMSGIELLRAIKKEYPDLGVIIITGYTSEATKKEAMDLGAYAYITKPFNVVNLLKTVFECLDQAQENA